MTHTELFHRRRRGARLVAERFHEARLHELEPGYRYFLATARRAQCGFEVERELGADITFHAVRVPRIGDERKNLSRASHAGDGVRAEVFEVDQTLEKILAPAVSVKEQYVALELVEEPEHLLFAFVLEHVRMHRQTQWAQGDSFSRNHSVGISRPRPSSLALLTTAAPTAAN